MLDSSMLILIALGGGALLFSFLFLMMGARSQGR